MPKLLRVYHASQAAERFLAGDAGTVDSKPVWVHKCDRCGRIHERVYEVEDDEQRIWRVGRTCCKRLFGWTPTADDILFTLTDELAPDLEPLMRDGNGWYHTQLATAELANYRTRPDVCRAIDAVRQKWRARGLYDRHIERVWNRWLDAQWKARNAPTS